MKRWYYYLAGHNRAWYAKERVATADVSFTYDDAYGRMATMVDGTGTTTYTYHAMAPPVLGATKLASVDGPLANDTIAYSYDELGRVTTRAINGAANTVTWTFDSLGRMTSEANALGTFTYGYDGVTNRLATVTYPNGQTSAYSYFGNTGDHRLQTIHHQYPGGATLSKFDYTYDAVGNILTWRQQADTAAATWAYAYDNADQLVAAIKRDTDPQQTVLNRYAYAYDRAGNRTTEQVDDLVTGATYNTVNELVTQQAAGAMAFSGTLSEPAVVTVGGVPAVVSATNAFQASVPVVSGTNTVTVTARDASGNSATQNYDLANSGTSKTFTYDANGNLSNDGTRTFEWDARNQLVALTVGTRRSEFSYDGQQHRVRVVEKVQGVVQTDSRFVWCGSDICEERASDESTVTRRTFALGEEVSDVPRFFAVDHLSSVRGVIDGAGMRVAAYDFDPLGRPSLTSGSDFSAVSFTGHRWQANGQLWLAMYRGYDSDTGRWINEDPIGPDGDSFNYYAYVENSPIAYTDELGLFKTCCRPVKTVGGLGCHCWVTLSDQHTIGAYRNGLTLTRQMDGRADNPTPPGSKCKDFGGGRCEDEKLKRKWNSEPPTSNYGTNNTSNTAVSEALRPFNIYLPRCAQGRRYYYDTLSNTIVPTLR